MKAWEYWKGFVKEGPQQIKVQSQERKDPENEYQRGQKGQWHDSLTPSNYETSLKTCNSFSLLRQKTIHTSFQGFAAESWDFSEDVSVDVSGCVCAGASAGASVELSRKELSSTERPLTLAPPLQRFNTYLSPAAGMSHVLSDGNSPIYSVRRCFEWKETLWSHLQIIVPIEEHSLKIYFAEHLDRNIIRLKIDAWFIFFEGDSNDFFVWETAISESMERAVVLRSLLGDSLLQYNPNDHVFKLMNLRMPVANISEYLRPCHPEISFGLDFTCLDLKIYSNELLLSEKATIVRLKGNHVTEYFMIDMFLPSRWKVAVEKRAKMVDDTDHVISGAIPACSSSLSEDRIKDGIKYLQDALAYIIVLAKLTKVDEDTFSMLRTFTQKSWTVEEFFGEGMQPTISDALSAIQSAFRESQVETSKILNFMKTLELISETFEMSGSFSAFREIDLFSDHKTFGTYLPALRHFSEAYKQQKTILNHHDTLVDAVFFADSEFKHICFIRYLGKMKSTKLSLATFQEFQSVVDLHVSYAYSDSFSSHSANDCYLLLKQLQTKLSDFADFFSRESALFSSYLSTSRLSDMKRDIKVHLLRIVNS